MQKTDKQDRPRRDQGEHAGIVRAIDRHVAGRIRARRKALGITQKDLAAAVSLSYQQIQKYETGANRVGAGRLYLIGKALKVSSAYFFDAVGETDFRLSAEQESKEIPLDVRKAIMRLIDALNK